MEKVPHVQRVRKPDGRVHLYFRKGDHREGPLLSADGSEELRAEVEAILKRLEVAQKAARPKEGTVGGMLLRYAGDGQKARPCAEFLGLAPSTQAEYLRMASEIREDVGDVELADVTSAWVAELMELWAGRGYKAANDRRQVLKNALQPAVLDDRIAKDPFAKVEKLERPHGAGEPHPTWEDYELDAAIEDAIATKQPGLARALALARWSGFRRGTICAIPLNARIWGFDAAQQRHRRLSWITEKRRIACDKPEDGRLTQLLERTPNRATTIAYNADGGVWKERQLSQAVERLVLRLAGKGKLRAGLTLHGLRHARGVELAMAGASDAEIMAQIEHATDKAAKIYRRQAQRRGLADNGQAKVDNVIDLRAKRKAENQA